MSASDQPGRFACSSRHRRTWIAPYTLDTPNTPANAIGTTTPVVDACDTLDIPAANPAPLLNPSGTQSFNNYSPFGRSGRFGYGKLNYSV